MSDYVVPKPKLSRACSTCIRAKRKCSLDLPRCTRCRELGKTCTYANQPLTGSSVSSRRDDVHDTRWLLKYLSGETDVSDKVVLNPSPARIHIDEPTWELTVDPHTFSYLNSKIREDVFAFGQTGGNTFIHPKIPSALLTYIRSWVELVTPGATHAECVEIVRQTHLERTIQRLVAAFPYLDGCVDLLSFTQALMLIQIITLFIIPPALLPVSIQQTALARHQLLKRVTELLWNSAPTYIPHDLAKHEAYALAESIRRTTIMSHELQAQCSLCWRGFFEFRLFGASLPFDRRLELWDATTEEFDRMMEHPMKWQPSSELVSYHEFCQMFDRMEIATVKRPFEAVLLVGAKGLDHVEQITGAQLL